MIEFSDGPAMFYRQATFHRRQTNHFATNLPANSKAVNVESGYVAEAGAGRLMPAGDPDPRALDFSVPSAKRVF